MALADLLDTLERDAEGRAAARMAAARAEADRLTAEARERLERRRAAALAEREGELWAAAASEIELARREAVREVLLAREAALERVFARARELLAARAADPALAPEWDRDAADALTFLGGREAVTRRPPEVAGVRVAALDGSIVIDGTLEGRLERLRSRLAIEVARRLETPE
ncbi:MAG TPA: hypothetical protein VFU46_01990 [Gemmatimonadales bacterium]|nr:hypothetical protein [Gemmatimonadales bacterium]